MAMPKGAIFQMFCVVPHLFPHILPALMISMGYLDVGKWVAAFDGGAHFGFDLVPLVIIIDCISILCHYLATHIGVVSGKNLAEICSEEYSRLTCIFLGIQAELSMIASDLTMILGIANGFDLLFGLDIFICIYLATVVAVLFPLSVPLLKICKAELLYIGISGSALFTYVLGVLVSHPEIPLSMGGMFPKLNRESLCSLMALLGSNIMPHNFYIHSSIVQKQGGLPNVALGALLHDHFFSIVFIFSGIFVVNNVVMSSAAVAFDNTGLVVLTVQDAFYLLDQIFRNRVAQLMFFLVLFFASQISSLSRNIGGLVVWNHLLGMHLPFGIHHVLVKVLVIILVFCAAFCGGAGGIYRMLIFCQVLSATLLPSSVIPLFRVASLRSIMGAYKIAWYLEVLAFSSFLGILMLNIIFILELLFGNSIWAVDLRGNVWTGVTLLFVVVLLISSTSLCLTLHLAVTPLKSASDAQDMQVWAWDSQNYHVEQSDSVAEYDANRMVHEVRESVPQRPTESQSSHSVPELDRCLPETNTNSEYDILKTAPSLDHVISCTCPASPIETSKSTGEVPFDMQHKVSTNNSIDAGSLQEARPKIPVIKNIPLAEDVHTVKDDEDGVPLDEKPVVGKPEDGKPVVGKPEEYSGGSLLTTCSAVLNCKDVRSKVNDLSNDSADISKKVGLGRAGRRQFASILDEFWGNLFDFHGQLTHEAKNKRIGVLLGMDLIDASGFKTVETTADESCKDFLEAERGPVIPNYSRDVDSSSNQSSIPSMFPSYGAQRGSTQWSTSMQSLNSYVQSCRRNFSAANERYYSSLHLPQWSDYRDHQPTSRESFQTSFYQEGDQTARSLGMSVNLPPTSKSLSPFFRNFNDPLTCTRGASELGSPCISGLDSDTSSISRLYAGRSHYEHTAYGTSRNNVSSYEKKYHSLPDISGLRISNRNSSWNDNAQQGSLVGSQLPMSRNEYERAQYLTSVPSAGLPVAFDELSPMKLNRDALHVPLSLNLDSKSFWSKQPFEQLFPVTPKKTFSYTESEIKLLQSLKCSVVKLLKLEGSDWLFRHDSGPDEELINLVAAKERILFEAPSGELNHDFAGEPKYQGKEADHTKSQSLLPNCGESCIWRAGLVVSFGVWCIRRILEIALIESRPELWGKYTFVLNRLQGILDPAFSKTRSPQFPCRCLEIEATGSSTMARPSQHNWRLQGSRNSDRVECTDAGMVFEIVKRVEAAISGRKGRAGTAAGDIAFPKGKENLASVLKRYKRRLSSKSPGEA